MLIIIYFYCLFQNSHKFNKKSISLYAMAVEKIWKLREGADADNVRQLSSELGVDPVLAELLVQRACIPLNRPVRSSAQALII